MMDSWNFAEVWEAIARRFPDADATVHGADRQSWRRFEGRADALAFHLLAAGAERQDRIALYLHNCPEYLESTFAAFKAGLVPVNTNYRYLEDELAYLWENADATTVVFHGSFGDRIELIRERVPGVRTWLWVDDGSGPCPTWALPYEDAVAHQTDGAVQGPWGRSGDDLLMIYTGGTTGRPKGVLWRQDDLIVRTCGRGTPLVTENPDTVGGAEGLIAQMDTPGPPGMPVCPLMHGTGWFTANVYLFQGGPVVTLPNRKLDWIEVLDTVEREHVGALTIVGDAFARPMLAELDAHPGRWDLSSLRLISSSGVMWSETVKAGLLRHQPAMFLLDTFASSEALGLGQSLSGGGSTERTGGFALGESTSVFTDDGRRVEPGSGERGRVAVPGRNPIGYHKDPVKTAETFVEIDGVRYSMPGDYATVEPDGTITLLGRGSGCINTAGEKVFPEEVEEALKLHPTVADAVVVGVPDERFGEIVTAIVEARPGATVDVDQLTAHVRASLAGYKVPRAVISVETIGRSPNGKVDYRALRQVAAERSLVSRFLDPYLAGITDAESVELLRPRLAHDVTMAGPFGTADGVDAVLAATAQPGLLGGLDWEDPQVDGQSIIGRAEVPAGMMICAVLLTIVTDGSRITSIIHEVELAPPPPATPVALDEKIATALHDAFADGCPVIVSYVDDRGAPHVSFRGTVQVHGVDQLALWIRDPHGGLLRALPTNPHLALLYRNPASRVGYEIGGRARVSIDDDTRAKVFGRSPQFEQGLDPARRGVAVIVEVDSVRGGPPDRPVNMQRDRAEPG